MNRRLTQKGGLKIIRKPYAGSKENVPAGRVRARPHQAYKMGLRSGYAAGIQKGKELCLAAVDYPTAARQGVLLQKGLEERRAREASKKTEAAWRSMAQRPMQAQAREWNIPRYARAKTDLIEDFIAEARRRNLVK
jgi:hypothetical protein